MDQNSKISLIVLASISAVLILACCCAILVMAGAAVWINAAVTPATTITRTSLSTLAPLPTFTAAPTTTRASLATPQPLVTATPRKTLVAQTVAPTATRAATRAATPTLTRTPRPTTAPSGQMSTEQQLLTVILPQRDMRLLAERLKKTGPIPQVVHANPPVYELGQESTFWVGNVDTMEHVQITARLEYITPHLYVWVEKGQKFNRQSLIRSADKFESQSYPTNREFFGSEWSPGVDNDVRLHILHSSGERMGSSVAGYYSSADEYSQMANPYSNEREMFYISLDGASPGSDFYDGVLAHEFQHMIHWANDRNEDTWVNEGCSELAAYLNGYDAGGFDWLFIFDPDVQLTSWPDGDSAAANYGSSYLFMAYFLGRFGEDMMKEVIAHPANGAAGFDAVLAGQGLTFGDVFADWLIANYTDNLAASLPALYQYPDHVVGPAATAAEHDRYPVDENSDVHQYAADYILLEGDEDIAITFSGDTLARLTATDAYSGRYAWWSNRGDDSDATLTRAFDLRGVQKATLNVQMWYDIEEDWDYAYIQVSTDGGQTWEILAGPSTTDSNPNGNSFGPAYTGSSDDWVLESLDLSPFAGQQILLRFEYVTDDAVNQPGWLIDDLSIPEIGYEQDFESGTDGWESAGFILSDNEVSQRYLVQIITLGKQVEVFRMELDEENQGGWELRGLGRQFDTAVLVIAALAPTTTEWAEYHYQIETLP